MLLLLFVTGVDEDDDDLLLFSLFCDVIKGLAFGLLSTLKFDKF